LDLLQLCAAAVQKLHVHLVGTIEVIAGDKQRNESAQYDQQKAQSNQGFNQ
jgi:hypothetical protein